MCSKYHGHTHYYQATILVINPRHACAARVTVLALCVSLCVCVCDSYAHAQYTQRAVVYVRSYYILYM